MRISPLEIQQKRFSKSIEGLQEDEVYSFLGLIREEMEDLLRDNFALKKEVEHLKENREVDAVIWNFISHCAEMKIGRTKRDDN